MPEIRWSAPEYEYHPKSAGWYLISILVALALVALALWQGNFLFAVFVVIAEIVVFYFARRMPQQIEFVLMQEGLTIGGKTAYQYRDLEGFAVRPLDQEFNEIVLKKKSHFAPYVKILVPAKETEAVQDFLKKFLPEIEYEESLLEHLGRLLRL